MKPPFELTEHGWGEFEIGVDVSRHKIRLAVGTS
jgi:hypothetical protein